KETKEFQLFPPYADEVYDAVARKAEKKLSKLMTIAAKQERDEATNAHMEEGEAQLLEVVTEDDASKQIRAAYNQLMMQILREKILIAGFRIDGRAAEDIRDLGAAIGLIPRVYGSVLFECGETQILGVTSLDMLRMEQTIGSLSPVESMRYIHHY